MLRLDDRDDLPGEVLADAVQLRQVPALPELARNVEAQRPDDARRVAVGADAERIVLRELEQVRDLLERRRDIGIHNRHGWKV